MEEKEYYKILYKSIVYGKENFQIVFISTIYGRKRL